MCKQFCSYFHILKLDSNIQIKCRALLWEELILQKSVTFARQDVIRKTQIIYRLEFNHSYMVEIANS